jgi:hypothetical protein
MGTAQLVTLRTANDETVPFQSELRVPRQLCT